MVEAASVPVQPAATVMILDDRPDLQVLMVRRAAKLAFAADSWVFPGGRVDPQDLPNDIEDLCHGLNDSEASSILQVDEGGLAWWVAACRETFEETGLLLARPGDPDQDSGPTDDGPTDDYLELLRRRRLIIDGPALQEVARFVTPVGPPRRYDARFFIASLGDSPAATDDGSRHVAVEEDNGEVTACQWFAPSEALAQWRAGTMQMMSPTIRMLACLERHTTANEIMDLARRRLPYQRVRVEDPDGDYRVLLPGEDGYETAELEVESGWVRLWPEQTP